jgi:hypothetical protein
MTPVERIRTALLSQVKPPVAKHPTPQPVEWPATAAPSVTVSEENLAALLSRLNTSSR